MSEIRVSAERLNALIEELALAADRCREYGVPVQASRVVVSALNLARNLAGDQGMLAPDAVATYAEMLAATEPDPAERARLRSEHTRLTAERQGWEKTARACVCAPGQCSRSEFRDHQGASPGCMVCADLDPDEPCYAAVLARLEAGQ